MLKQGATEVIPETLELSLIISSHVLLLMGIPAIEVFEMVEKVRNNRYKLLQKVLPDTTLFNNHHSDQPQTTKKQLYPVTILQGAKAINRSLESLGLERFDVQVVAIRRAGFNYSEPGPKMTIQANDILVLFGTEESIQSAEQYILMQE